ncbi:MAG: guanylate kinase [Bacteriovoracia bacterium]
MSNKRKQKTQSKLVVLSAPSGSGKTTLAGMLLEKTDRFILSISYTTRQPRGAEKDGVDYFFVSEKKFHSMVENDEFLEYEHNFGKHWYGTPKQFVDKAIAEKKNVLFDIDVKGAQKLKSIYKKQCVSIFVHPPSLEELEKRLRGRATDTPEAIQKRLATAVEEIKQAPKFDYEIINHSIEQAYSELISILKKESCI